MSYLPMMRKIFRSWAVVGLPLAIVLPTAADAATFSQLYVFGDSLSDVGNTFKATGGFLPPGPFYVDGRFSNGAIWVDYLAPKLGLTLGLENNFAYGGARTDSGNGLNPLLNGVVTLPGLTQQLDAFKLKNPKPADDALYILLAGNNDYLNPDLQDPAGTVQGAVTNLTNAINTLVGNGAKNVLVSNLTDLGKVPLVQTDPQRAAGLNFLSTAHNAGLAQNLGALSATYGSSVNLIPFDLAGLFNQAVTTPNDFGFTNVKDACFAASPILASTSSTGIPLCSNPNQYLFWDGFHPTTRAHQIISDAAFLVLDQQPPLPKPVPEPAAPIAMLVLGGLMGARSRVRRQPVN